MDAVAAGPAATRRRLSDDPFSLWTSVLLHAALFAALTLSVSRSPPTPPPDVQAIDISMLPGDGKDAVIPKVAAPKVEESKSQQLDDPVRQTVSDQPADVVDDVKPEPAKASTGSTSDAPPSTDAGAPDAGGSIWTPPPPRPNDAEAGMSATTAVRERVVLPHVELGKGASDAVLLSYDQGRFTDTASISEALRLTGAGRITMSASVDEKGVVTQCTVSVTSGSQLLDERACALISSYQYRPAQDSRGVPHPSIVSEVLEWAKDGVFGSAQSVSPDGTPAAGVPGRVVPSSAPSRMPTVAIPQRR